VLRRVVKGDIVCVVPSFHKTMDQMGLPVCPRLYVFDVCDVRVYFGVGVGFGVLLLVSRLALDSSSYSD